MRKFKKILTIFTILNLQFFLIPEIVMPQSPRLFINEFMAANQRALSDSNGEYDDWIEIYNGEDFDIDLTGYYLTDNLANPLKWSFPAIFLPAKDYLLIWADDHLNQSGIHANFKLSAAGEQIGLFDGTNFIDSLTFGQQKTDISYGRYPNGTVVWEFFDSPTPGSSNAMPGQSRTKRPSFSPEGGFYNDVMTVKISTASTAARIYYTLDCSEPASNKILYTAPIPLNRTTVVRAIALESGYLPSEMMTHTYIFDHDLNIATLSLVTDPPSLWDPDSGIYVNPDERGDAWERPVAMEFYTENNSLGFRANGGLRIHGKTAQLYDKKPFRLYFRSEYGQNQLNYSLFQTKPQLTSFKRLVVHSGGTDMPINPYSHGWTLIRDPLMYELTRRVGGIYAANRPVALYLNSEPWGIYNLLERIDKYYTESNFGEIDVDLIENGGEIKEGDLAAWNAMIAFFENTDLGSDSNFEMAKALIDIDNFTDYCIIEIFGGNKDWPQNNFFAFRPRKADARWQFIIWDMDGCFGPYGVSSNTLEWVTRDDASTLLVRKFLENEHYKYFFINRFADLLNTTFLSENVNELIDSLASVIQADLSFETDRWSSSFEEWQNNGINGELHDFAERRPDHVRSHLRRYFNLDQNVTVTIDPCQGGEGKIKVNTVLLNTFPWTGIYFSEIPIILQAIPKPGYRFKAWSDPSLAGDSGTATISLLNDFQVYAIFEHDPQPEQIVINEINYNSAVDFNPQDWIELYNPTPEALDLSGWHLKDDDNAHDFVFPTGITVDPYGFLVICRDSTAFCGLFPKVTHYVGNMNFGLGRGDDQVRVLNSLALLIDSVAYDDRSPWTDLPDGNGPSLELIDPDLNNTLPENWQASMWHGTPGQKNSFRIVINEINYNSAVDFNPEDWIELYNPAAGTVAVSGWHLKDNNNNDFTFPAGTTIAPHGFLIVCYDKTAFKVFFPALTNIIGNFKFGLDEDGDDVKIYNEYYNLVDSVKYDNDKPWAIEAIGLGPTLELLNPELDNTISRSWQASAGHGSPCQATRALPVVTHFVVKDSSKSTIVTNSRDVLIEITGYDFDGQVISWHINESGIPPLPAEFGWENKPTAYHIECEEGDVPIFGWVLDNDNQVSRLTDTSHTTIRLMLGGNLYNISGTINYANKSQSVPNAVVKVNYIYGTGIDTTDETGNFVFADTDTGLVKLKPAKTGDIRNAIRGSDALLILQYLASLLNISNEEKFAADVTGDGNITDSDVQAILRYLTFYTSNIGNTNYWRFVPTDTSFTLNSDETINFKAYLSGDANLDWNSGSNTGQQTGGDSINSNVTLKLNQVNTQNKKYIELPLIIEPDSEAVNTIVLSLQYDPVYLIYKATETTESSKNFRMEVNGTQTGEVHIAMIGIESIITNDEILKIRFEVVDPTIRNRSTQLRFNRAMVNDLNAKTLNGIVIFTNTSDIELLPQDFILFQNYPNPFNSETLIQYQIAEPSAIRLTIYNVMGSEVRTIVNERNQAAGCYQAIWDGKDGHGMEMPSGIYVYELKTDRFVQRKKLAMVK